MINNPDKEPEIAEVIKQMSENEVTKDLSTEEQVEVFAGVIQEHVSLLPEKEKKNILLILQKIQLRDFLLLIKVEFPM